MNVPQLGVETKEDTLREEGLQSTKGVASKRKNYPQAIRVDEIMATT